MSGFNRTESAEQLSKLPASIPCVLQEEGHKGRKQFFTERRIDGDKVKFVVDPNRCGFDISLLSAGMECMLYPAHAFSSKLVFCGLA